jgi:hypothetical protein
LMPLLLYLALACRSSSVHAPSLRKEGVDCRIALLLAMMKGKIRAAFWQTRSAFR